MRLVFALLFLCFLLAVLGNENVVPERVEALRLEPNRSCSIRINPDGAEDVFLPCPCCAAPQNAGVMSLPFTASDGHSLDARWTRTASDGFNFSRGDSITLTWGFAQDGTSVASGSTLEDSSLVATLDNNFSEASTSSDLTGRSWFLIFEGTFDRFAALSGLNFSYEPNDNGATLNGGGRGLLGSVADIRIGGRSIDGQTGSNTLAFNYFPNAGDMVIDTDNTNFFDANDRGFRNVVAHEFGHGLGMSHLLSNSEGFLLEPFISTSFEGPQHADILALHRGYGDHFEKGNGNDTVTNATSLGNIDNFTGVGLDGALEEVGMADNDFVSIDGTSDTDVFRFDVTQNGSYNFTVTPLGYSYDLAEQASDGSANQATRVTVNTSQLNDLQFRLLDQNGSSVLGVADVGGTGVAESLTNVSLSAGTYYIEVTGSDDRVQFYSLNSSVAIEQTEIVVTTGTIAPTTNLLASQPVGGQQYLVNVGRSPGQGQTFSFASDFTLEAVTVQVGADTRGAQNAAENAAALSLNVYDVSDGFTLDETTLLESFNDPTATDFDATTAISTPLYLTFNLNPNGTAALGELSANAVYAFTITSNSTADLGFRIERSRADEYSDGNGIFTSNDNVPTQRRTDDAVFFLQGTGGAPDVLIGDVNDDGMVSFLDIAPFIAVLSVGDFVDQADVNRDGMVDFLDIAPFIALLSGA